MSNLPVSSRLKTPASRIAKPPGAAKAEGIPASRIAVKPPSFETPQKLSGLRQPLAKRNSGEVDKTTEKRSSVSAVGLITPRSKSGSLTKLNKTGLARPSQFTPVGKRENLKSQSSVSSTGSLKKETEQPVLTREKTQESLKDVETGILFKVGDRVLVGDSKAGVIEYLGETKFAKGYWAGIKLDEPSGKNDGCVAGVRYFDCEPLHGVFSKSNRLHKINIFPNKKASISEFKLEDSNVLKIGDPVLVSGSKLGILRYLGPTEFAKGEWAGVELEEAFGKNDGAVAGTRYFSCEMKHGLFAPSSKVVKSKRHSLSKKSSVVLIPETSLANAAKSVFNKTTSLSSETSESHIAEVASPSEKPSAVAANVSGSPIEALHQALKKTPSNAQHVAALQSALEEREREIRKMLMEKELEKAEKLQGLDETTKNGDSTSPKQDLQDKDDIIQSLKDNLETYKKDSSVIQTKLDEEKKKYEDLQFMLEEEKITDDELKNHVKEDESKIKELSDETKEKNELIHSLQRDLQEARAGNLNNEAKVLQLHDKLNESEIRFTHATDNAQENTVKHETLLTNTQKELEQSREEVRQKCEQINQLENKVNEQMKQQKGIEEQGEKELKEKLSAAELETKSAFEECERLKYEKDQIVEELTKLQNERNELLLNLTSTTEKLQRVERQYKDLLDANTMLTKEKDRAIKANSLSLNAQILDLESQLSQSYTQVSQLEDTMATNSDVAEQKRRELQTVLANATRELGEQKEEVNKKTLLVDEMERKLNAQLTRQKEIEKEVESLDQADKSLALMQEAHRAEVEALQSKVNSLTETITEMTNKQGYVVERHNSEMAMFATSKEEEMKKFKEKIHAVEIEKSTTHKECENLRMEKEKVLEEFSRLQNENNDVLLSKNAISEKRQELEKKYNDLSEANVKLSSERDYTIQMCEKQNQRLDILKKEKESLVLQKDLLAKEKVFLESNLSNLHSESTKGQGELIENKESEIRSLNAELEEALKDKQIINDTVTALKEEKNTLESDLVAKADDVFRLQSEQHKMHSLSQEFQNEVSDLKKKILEDAKRSRQKIETLSNEIAILKDDLDEGKILLKRKEEGIRTYKEQIERMGSDGVPKSPMDGDILENASTLLIRLHEAESKLSVLQSEKESVEEQVEFLNSVIVELQNKNLKANKAMLEARDESILLHGLDSESDDEVSAKPKYTMRIFCDICDVFDKHETDECPLQESSDDTSGVKNNGDRNYERPYCNICEAFGHWTEDCDDEETY